MYWQNKFHIENLDRNIEEKINWRSPVDYRIEYESKTA